jgi:PDZ domain
MASRSDPTRLFFLAALLVLIGVLGAAFVVSRQGAPEAEPDERLPQPTRAAPRGLRPPRQHARRSLHEVNRSRRPALSNPLTAPGAAESQPEERPPAGEPGSEGGAAEAAGSNVPPADDAHPAGNGGPVVDYSRSAIERALAGVGLDATKMADLERRYRALAAAEVQLRHNAEQEGSLDSTSLAEKLDLIATARLSIRQEIGDEAYDLFLFAIGEPNRVFVTDVEQHSPGEIAGLQAGDVVVRYDGARLFSTDDLLAEIDAATPGKVVRLDVLRQGNPIQIEVADGSPGTGFAATQEPPAPLK